MAKSRANSAAPIPRPNEHATEPRRALLVAGQIVLAQSAYAEQLSVSACDKRERQAVRVHVTVELGAACLECLVAQNVPIVIERLLRQRRNEFGMVRQIVDAQGLTRQESQRRRPSTATRKNKADHWGHGITVS